MSTFVNKLINLNTVTLLHPDLCVDGNKIKQVNMKLHNLKE